MPDLVLKVPLGPTVVLRGHEVAALFRHRYMLLLYFAAACLGLIGSTGASEDTPPEIRLALAALQVLAGVGVMVLLVLLQRGLARRKARAGSVHLGWLTFAATVTAVAAAEFCDTVLIGLPRTPPAFLVLQCVFYLVLVEVMVSALFQFTLPRMLADLRPQGAARGQGDV